jgi:hypothetical protein
MADFCLLLGFILAVGCDQQLFVRGEFHAERRIWMCSNAHEVAIATDCQPSSLLYPDLRALRPSRLAFDSVDRDGRARHVLRFSATIWNAGEGPLELRGESSGALTEVIQRVYDTGGSFTEQLVGKFVFHQDHRHWHFENFAEYQLWTAEAYDSWLASGRAAGEPGWSSSKTTGQGTSFCIRDSRRVDRGLPGVPAARVYQKCDRENQGISVGWGDTYGPSLVDQWIDLGDHALPSGEYVLRIIADPLNLLLESPAWLDSPRESALDNEAATLFRVRNGRIEVT